MLHQIRTRRGVLTDRERTLLLAIARAAIPAGRVFPGPDMGTVDKVDAFLAQIPRSLARGYRGMAHAVDMAALLRFRRRFHRLPEHKQLRVLEGFTRGGVARRLSIRGLITPLKVAHFDDPAFYKQIGCVYEFEKPAPETPPRYMVDRVHAGAALKEDLELECDVVVIGSGAGGAVVACELAERGHAVVLLEEGAYFRREDFNGRPFEMQSRMYRNAGATFSIGNCGIPIPMGKTVGGSTTINSGTCYRVPDRVLTKWRDELGLEDFTPEMFAPYFERVERIIGVETAKMEYVGGVGRVIARGCDKLGYAHGPLRRNAPDCDGKGVCVFGCPTDAKRSTNVSYVPLALKAGAELFHGTRVDNILIEHGRATGVEARCGKHTLTVKAKAVVVACGSLITPLLLLNNKLANSSGQLGRNLSIHPAAGSMARFDEDISSFNSIPQGYAIEEFQDEGLLFEGGTMPLEVMMSALPLIGHKLVELAEAYDRVAVFGFMVEDTSRGRVRSIRGRSVITYVLNDHDLARLKRGFEILARVFFAAGARSVYAPIHGFEEMRGEADLHRFRQTKLRARDFDLSAYHPLGTARMGPNPSTSVVGPNHEAHDVPGLYIVDGSAVPSSLAVNPQVTIMAMATRAAEHIAKAI